MADFTVEFYETSTGASPVIDFLEELKASDPGDHAAVLAGLAKLRNPQYHRPPLCKSLGADLFELRHIGKLNTRSLPPKTGAKIGSKGIPHESDKFRSLSRGAITRS